MTVATHPAVDLLLRDCAPVAVGVSGGKDSQAAALATFRHLDNIGHSGPRILIHADLGSVEWNDSFRMCEELADHLECDLVTVRRKGGGLMERWESRWLSSKTRYEMLSTVTLVPCWSTPDMRFCTSEQKTHVIIAELKRRFKGQTVINVTGVRREESLNRARLPAANLDNSGKFWNWRPIIDLTVEEVFATIDASGLHPHPAYRIYGMSRVSCRFCIMQSLADMITASAQKEAQDIYRRIKDLGVNYQRHLHVTAVDVDPRAVHMAYIQFSLMHIPAHVIVGDTLRLEFREDWYTPAHVMGFWSGRLAADRLAIAPTAPAPTPSPPAIAAKAKPPPKPTSGLPLFDFGL